MDVSPFNGAGRHQSTSRMPTMLASNYGPANFDIRHSLKSSIVYQLPFGKGRRWAEHKSCARTQTIGGWQVSAIVINQTGNPFTVTYNGANNSYSQAGSWYPNVLRPAQTGFHKSINEWYDPTAYATAANGTFGDSRRNSLRRAGVNTTNLSLRKNILSRQGHRSADPWGRF